MSNYLKHKPGSLEEIVAKQGSYREDSGYQAMFKKELDKAGKGIGSMSPKEKKAFFNKIEKTWKGRGTKSEGNAFGAAVAKAKKDGDSNFKVGDKEYKVERFGRGDYVNDFRVSGSMEIRKAAFEFDRMAKRINRHLNQRAEMLSGISHDLRTPLTRLKLQLAMLRQKDLSEKMSKDIDEMEKMLSLIHI